MEDKKVEPVAEMIAANPALLSETKQFKIGKEEVALTPVLYAAHTGRRLILVKLHEAGADIDRAGDKGLTPLHMAARCRNGTATLNYILSLSAANLNATTHAGVTPLIEAARQGSRDSVTALLSRGANMEISGKFAMPAIVAAAAAGHGDIVEQLAKAGASVDAPNNGGRTALWYAAYANQPRLADALIARGANIRTADAHGVTLLMGAARVGNLALVTQLIEAGLDINQRDSNGCTALHYTCLADAGPRVQEVAKFLVASGAYVDAVDKQGEMPIDRARRLKSTWQQPMTDFFQSKMQDPASARDPAYLAPFTEGSEQKVTTMKALKFRPAANHPKY